MANFNSPLPIESFSDNMKAAIGSSNIIDLKQLIRRAPPQKGTSHWVQSYRAKGSWDSTTGTWISQEALSRPAGAIPRRQWEALADSNKTFAAWQKRLTPHQDIDFYMSLCDKDDIETGHEFESLDELEMNNDPTSAIMQELAKGFIVKGNNKVITALKSATTTRKMLDLTASSSTFGKVKQVSEAWATNNPKCEFTTTNVGYFSLVDDAPLLEADMEACAVPHGATKIVLINPYDAAMMKTKSFDKFTSKDFPFVSKKDITNGYGGLPDLFGFSFIVSTQVAKGEMLAFVPECMTLVPYKDLTQALDYDIMIRNHLIYYANEQWGVVCNDDRGRFKIKVKAETQSNTGQGGSD